MGKIFWVTKFLGSKNVLVKKNSVKKISGPKKFWGKKILSQKNFGLIDLNPKFVLSKEKTGRVNPRWRIYDPPPRK